MTTPSHHQQPPRIEVEIDRKAQRGSEKLLRPQVERDTEIYNNFATPLVGKFLNLTEDSCLIHCPSCSVKAMSKVEMELNRNTWREIILSRIFTCLCVCCCCCCDGEKDLRMPIMSEKANHYCSNCGCYFGQESRYPKKTI